MAFKPCFTPKSRMGLASVAFVPYLLAALWSYPVPLCLPMPQPVAPMPKPVASMPKPMVSVPKPMVSVPKLMVSILEPIVPKPIGPMPKPIARSGLCCFYLAVIGSDQSLCTCQY